MASLQGQRLKYTLTHHRNPKHTHEEFINWMTTVHIPLAMPVFKKYGLISYSLFITPQPLTTGLKPFVQPLFPTWDFADYDCVIEYVLPDVETIGKLFADPEWGVAVKDGAEWIDLSKALVTLGYATPFLREDGEVVNLGIEK